MRPPSTRSARRPINPRETRERFGGKHAGPILSLRLGKLSPCCCRHAATIADEAAPCIPTKRWNRR